MKSFASTRNDLKRNSECFLFRETKFRVFLCSAKRFGTKFRFFMFRLTDGITAKQPSVSSYSVFRGIINLSKNGNPCWKSWERWPAELNKCRLLFNEHVLTSSNYCDWQLLLLCFVPCQQFFFLGIEPAGTGNWSDAAAFKLIQGISVYIYQEFLSFPYSFCFIFIIFFIQMALVSEFSCPRSLSLICHYWLTVFCSCSWKSTYRICFLSFSALFT